MTGIVNRVPTGLLSILDMKARGQNPRNLSPNVDLSIEGLQLYLLQNRETRIGQTGIINAPGWWPDTSAGASPCRVPDNEYWYVWAGGYRTFVAVAAATNYRLRPAVLSIGQTVTFPTLYGGATTYGTGFFMDSDINTAPFWMGPGDVYGLYATVVTLGVAQAVDLSLYVTRVPV